MSPYRDIVPFDPEVDMERPDLSASQLVVLSFMLSSAPHSSCDLQREARFSSVSLL